MDYTRKIITYALGGRKLPITVSIHASNEMMTTQNVCAFCDDTMDLVRNSLETVKVKLTRLSKTEDTDVNCCLGCRDMIKRIRQSIFDRYNRKAELPYIHTNTIKWLSGDGSVFMTIYSKMRVERIDEHAYTPQCHLCGALSDTPFHKTFLPYILGQEDRMPPMNVCKDCNHKQTVIKALGFLPKYEGFTELECAVTDNEFLIMDNMFHHYSDALVSPDAIWDAFSTGPIKDTYTCYICNTAYAADLITQDGYNQYLDAHCGCDEKSQTVSKYLDLEYEGYYICIDRIIEPEANKYIYWIMQHLSTNSDDVYLSSDKNYLTCAEAVYAACCKILDLHEK